MLLGALNELALLLNQQLASAYERLLKLSNRYGREGPPQVGASLSTAFIICRLFATPHSP